MGWAEFRRWGCELGVEFRGYRCWGDVNFVGEGKGRAEFRGFGAFLVLRDYSLVIVLPHISSFSTLIFPSSSSFSISLSKS